MQITITVFVNEEIKYLTKILTIRGYHCIALKRKHYYSFSCTVLEYIVVHINQYVKSTLTLGPSIFTGFPLTRFDDSIGGFTGCIVVVGGGCVVIGRREPSCNTIKKETYY